MTAQFDPQRSALIRSALITQASSPTVRRHPWSGLALVLVGVLAGTSATTAAFASGAPLPMGPRPVSPSASSEPQLKNVLVLGGDKAAQPTVLAVVEVNREPSTDGKQGTTTTLYRLVPLSTKTITVTDGMQIRPEGDTAGQAHWVMTTATCTGKGAVSIGSGDQTEMIECGSGDQMASVNPAAVLTVHIRGSVTVVATVTTFALRKP